MFASGRTGQRASHRAVGASKSFVDNPRFQLLADSFRRGASLYPEKHLARARGWVRKTNKTFVWLLLRMCLVGHVERRKSAKITTGRTGWLLSEIKSKILPGLCVYGLVRMLVNLSFQYQHDYYLIRLHDLHRRQVSPTVPQELGQPRRAQLQYDISTIGSFKAGQNDEADRLRAALSWTRAVLKWLGAPHLRATIVCQCVYVTIVMLVLLCLVQGVLRFRLAWPRDLELVGELLLHRGVERRRLNSLIERELCRLAQSSWNFHLWCRPNRLNAAHDHLTLRQTLYEMHKRKLLMPLNRQAEWLDLLELVFSGFCVAVAGWSVIYNTACYILLPYWTGVQFESGPMDALFEFDILLVVLFAAAAVLFYQAVCFVVCLDQLKLIKALERLLYGCINTNERLLLLLQHHHHQRRLLSARLTINLTLALLHFRIFVRQFERPRRVLGAISFTALSTVVLHPLMMRLHAPYIQSETLKRNYYIFAVSAAFFVSCYLSQVCHIHGRCLGLYRALSSLLAHSVRLTATPGAQPDLHTVMLLRRTLHAPHQLEQDLTVRQYGLLFTYSNLIKVYFWAGLVVLSFYVESSGTSGAGPAAGLMDSLFGRLLSDPFGFYAD